MQRIKEVKNLKELARLILNNNELTYLEKQEIINDLKYGSEEYLELFKDKIIKILQKKEINNKLIK